MTRFSLSFIGYFQRTSNFNEKTQKSSEISYSLHNILCFSELWSSYSPSTMVCERVTTHKTFKLQKFLEIQVNLKICFLASFKINSKLGFWWVYILAIYILASYSTYSLAFHYSHMFYIWFLEQSTRLKSKTTVIWKINLWP